MNEEEVEIVNDNYQKMYKYANIASKEVKKLRKSVYKKDKKNDHYISELKNKENEIEKLKSKMKNIKDPVCEAGDNSIDSLFEDFYLQMTDAEKIELDKEVEEELIIEKKQNQI